MRETRLSGSEGGGTGNLTGPPYPYQRTPTLAPSVVIHADGVLSYRVSIADFVPEIRTYV